jgi:hypothetical protein
MQDAKSCGSWSGCCGFLAQRRALCDATVLSASGQALPELR